MSDVLRALSECFRADPFHHGKIGQGYREYDGFYSRMLGAFEEAAEDPDGFAARHRPASEQPEQPRQPLQQRQGSTVQVPDAADIYARRAAAMGRT